MSKPAAFELLVDALRSLPGVGTKNATKWAFFLLQQDQVYIDEFIKRLANAKKLLNYCSICGNLTELTQCSICTNEFRDQSTLLIVSTVEELERIESANFYKGLYHVTGGELSFRKSKAVEHTNIRTLLPRINNGLFQEIIIATNYTHDGELTAEYITKMLADFKHLKIYRIGFGLPLNSAIDYADDQTLKQSIQNKRLILTNN